jgi:ParB-like chromosome segregation protein Spo0J
MPERASPSLFESVPDNYQGLRLSGVIYMDPAELKPNPLNASFEALKDRLYLAGLEQDIRLHGIINALIVTQEYLLIEGHSRWQIANKLALPLVPVRTILSKLEDSALKERLYLGNLNRFEISKDARTKMFADLYPHIFYDASSSIPEELALSMGLSVSQVRNERQLLLYAMGLKEEGQAGSEVTIAELGAARKQMNHARREREKLKRLQWQVVVQLPSSSQEADALPLLLSHEPVYRPAALDILQSYKLISLNARTYHLYTQSDQLIASLDPNTFADIEELDRFAKDVLLNFHQLVQKRKE